VSNVKEGDLAVMVSGDEHNIGTIFRVGKRDEEEFGTWWFCENLNSAVLYVGGFIERRVPPGRIASADDRDLRPLRDQEGLDEQLAIARANGNDVPGLTLPEKEKDHATV